MFGTGYIGLVTGTCFAELGNDVICVDVDQKKIEDLKRGIIPIYEPGLEEIVKRNHQEGRLSFTMDAAKAIEASDILFIAVGTPSNPDGSANLEYVLQVAKTIGKHINGYKVIVDKSTVPVETSELVSNTIRSAMGVKKHDYAVVSNPEFLKEGEAINDFMMPDRIIVGVQDERAKAIMQELYKPLERANKPIVFTSVRSAEIIKYASNAMLATRISFMNELSHLCEAAGGNIKEVAKGMGLDDRIGPRFLQAGVGYGGSCFPKDVQALAHTFRRYGCDTHLVDAVEKINEKQKRSLFPKIHHLLGQDLAGKVVAVMGLAFKPKTDDMRYAPSIEIIHYLHQKGVRIQAFDPVAMEVAKTVFTGIKIDYKKDPYETLRGADLAVFVTEWNEFRMLDLERVSLLMKQKKIVDGRNIFSTGIMQKAGFDYIGVGKKAVGISYYSNPIKFTQIKPRITKKTSH